MEYEVLLSDIKSSLSDISKSIKELDVRLKTIELDLSRYKVYNSFLECNYTKLVEIVDAHNNKKQAQKSITTDVAKSLIINSIMFGVQAFIIGALIILKILK